MTLVPLGLVSRCRHHIVISNDKEEQATAKVVDKVVNDKFVQLHSLVFYVGNAVLAIWRYT